MTFDLLVVGFAAAFDATFRQIVVLGKFALEAAAANLAHEPRCSNNAIMSKLPIFVLLAIFFENHHFFLLLLL